MAQDTRKDPRAKVLTMTVRYKSATVDEFIEHHSHDVSRGGIFIKTPSPFLPGTLLKFEIRIADDKAMLQGVGRVVWKREPAGVGPEKPAGMGVKFIKVDEASRALIDRLVASKGSAASAYDAEVPMDASASAALAPPPAPPPRAAPPAVNRAPVGAAPARPAAVAPVGSALRKATMIGLGIDAATAPSSTPKQQAGRSQAARPPEPMFPKTYSEADMPPPEERTVMKQAAQLLEEALKGAGGSIDEVSAGPVAVEAARPKAPRPMIEPVEAPSVPDESDEDEGPLSPPVASTPIPLQKRSTPPSSPRPLEAPAHGPPARVVAAAPVVEPVKKKTSGGRAALSLLFVAGAAAAAYVVYQKNSPSGDTPPEQPAIVATTPPPPVVTTAPAPVETAAPIASAAAGSPSSAPSASAASSKSGASATAAIRPVVAPVKPGKPIEGTPPPVEKPPVAERPAPVEKAPPVVAAPKPKPAPKVPVEEGAVAPAEKKPKPVPKPPADDNPY